MNKLKLILAIMLFNSLFFYIHSDVNAQTNLKQNEDVIYNEIFLLYPEDEEVPSFNFKEIHADHNKTTLMNPVESLNELIEREDFEGHALPSGLANLTCKLTSGDLVCDWSATLISDHIIYVNQNIDYYKDGYFIAQDRFNYPGTGTRTIRNQGEIRNVLSGQWRAHLNGSVTGRYAVYQLYSYSKYVKVP